MKSKTTRRTTRTRAAKAAITPPKPRTFGDGTRIAPVSLHSAAIARGEYVTEDGDKSEVSVEIFRQKGTLVLDIGLDEGAGANAAEAWIVDPITPEQLVQLQQCLTVALIEARVLGLLPTTTEA